MGIKQTIDADLKNSLLAGDKKKSSILRVIKSTILDLEIAKKKRDSGLEENELIELLQKEAKKRDDTAEIYDKAGDVVRSENEKLEADLIRSYLPQQMSETELTHVIDEVVGDEKIEMKDIGRVINSVKIRVEGAADSSLIAKLVKEKISQ